LDRGEQRKWKEPEELGLSIQSLGLLLGNSLSVPGDKATLGVSVGLVSDQILKRLLEKSEDALTGPELEVADSHLLHGGELGGLAFLGNNENSVVGSLDTFGIHFPHFFLTDGNESSAPDLLTRLSDVEQIKGTCKSKNNHKIIETCLTILLQFHQQPRLGRISVDRSSFLPEVVDGSSMEM
jgi:hypothetical protein